MSCVVAANAATTAGIAIPASIGVIAVIALLVSLAIQEIAAEGEGAKWRSLAHRLDIVSIPLLVVFAGITVTKITSVLGA